MRSKILIVAAVVVLAAIGVKVGLDRRAGGPASGPAPAAPGIVLTSPSAVTTDGVRRDRDHAAVFQRAFWRRPTPADRVLHAERRDWTKDANNNVEKWEWFIAIEPSPAFREWLLKDNPFELVAVPSGTELKPVGTPPDWFPPATDLATFTRYRNREGRYQVFHDAAKNRLYAADAGGGFAPASK